MTFYGEALRVDRAVGGPVSDFGDALRYLYCDDLSQTVPAGESFLVGIDPDPQQLTATDEAVITWVVETGADSDGTLTLSSGLDPSWNLTDPSLASESLGSHSVLGARRIVLEQTGITAADVLAMNQPILNVEGVSGTVTIRQVRLRVWPVGGPSGAWAPGAAFPIDGAQDIYKAMAEVDSATYATPQEAAQAGRAAFPGGTPQWDLDPTADVLSDVQIRAGGIPVVYDSLFAKRLTYLRFRPARVFTTTAGDVGQHPDIVVGDDGGSVRAIGGGALWTQLDSWNGGVRVEAGSDPTVGLAIDAVDIALTPAAGSTTAYDGDVPWPTVFSTTVPGTLLSLPTQPYLLFGTETSYWHVDPTTGPLQQQGTAILEGVSANAVAPAHEWWNPALPWVPERQPRFYVKDYEGDWRPVGFGKPASDTSRFHVWTPVGWYVECLDGETYSNAHPLKVLREDGVTWDTVAHMRPA